MFIQSFLFIYLDYALDSRFCLNWVHFWIRVENFELCQKKFQFIFSLFSISCFDCVCVGPLWRFNLYLGKIHTCSFIAFMFAMLVHTKCLRKCPNGILVLFWTPMSTKLWELPWLYMFIMFWSLVVCFTHFDPNVLSHAFHMYHLCTPHAHTCSLIMFLHFNDARFMLLHI